MPDFLMSAVLALDLALLEEDPRVPCQIVDDEGATTTLQPPPPDEVDLQVRYRTTLNLCIVASSQLLLSSLDSDCLTEYSTTSEPTTVKTPLNHLLTSCLNEASTRMGTTPSCLIRRDSHRRRLSGRGEEQSGVRK